MQANGISVHIVIVIVWICFLRYYLIRDETEHEFQLFFPNGAGFWSVYGMKNKPIK